MRRPVLLALAAALALAPGAGAATHTADVAPWSVRDDHQPATSGPVLTSDGTIVFGLRRSNSVFDVMRLAPGASAPTVVTSFAIPDETSDLGPYLWVTMAAAGRGFIVYHGQYTGAYCCYGSMSDTHLTSYADASSPGTDIPLCTGGSATAVADADHALLDVRCPPAVYDDVVRDLATGQDTPVTFPAQGHGTGLAGRFISWDGAHVDPATDVWTSVAGVLDLTTGAEIRRVDDAFDSTVLPDGTFFYTTGVWGPRVVNRWDPGAGAGVALPNVSGEILTAAGDRLLTIDQLNVLHVWGRDGTELGRLNNGNPGVAFDGQRIAMLSPACTMVRVVSWDVGSPAPQLLNPVCGPVTVGRVEARSPTARVRLTCPATVGAGCLGSVLLHTPKPAKAHARRVALHPGEQRWFALATPLSSRRCRALARTRTWRLALITNTAYGENKATVRRRPSVDCG